MYWVLPGVLEVCRHEALSSPLYTPALFHSSTPLLLHLHLHCTTLIKSILPTTATPEGDFRGSSRPGLSPDSRSPAVEMTTRKYLCENRQQEDPPMRKWANSVDHKAGLSICTPSSCSRNVKCGGTTLRTQYSGVSRASVSSSSAYAGTEG